MNQKAEKLKAVEVKRQQSVSGRTELSEVREEHHQKDLRKSGQSQQVVIQEVHQTGQVLTLAKSYALSKLQQFQQQNTLSENYI